MKTVDLGANRPSLTDLLALAREKNILMRTESGEEFIVAEVEDFDREIALTRQNDELMALLEARSREGAYITLQDARKRLGL